MDMLESRMRVSVQVFARSTHYCLWLSEVRIVQPCSFSDMGDLYFHISEHWGMVRVKQVHIGSISHCFLQLHVVLLHKVELSPLRYVRSVPIELLRFFIVSERSLRSLVPIVIANPVKHSPRAHLWASGLGLLILPLVPTEAVVVSLVSFELLERQLPSLHSTQIIGCVFRDWSLLRHDYQRGLAHLGLVLPCFVAHRCGQQALVPRFSSRLRRFWRNRGKEFMLNNISAQEVGLLRK